MEKTKKLSEYTAKDIKAVFQKKKRQPTAIIQFQKKNNGIRMMLEQCDSEINFRNRIIGR